MTVEEVISQSQVEASPDWQRSVGKHLEYSHYRKKDSGAHAECKHGVCKIHHDEHNPHAGLKDSIKHLIEDAPEVALTSVGATATMLTGLYGYKRHLDSKVAVTTSSDRSNAPASTVL